MALVLPALQVVHPSTYGAPRPPRPVHRFPSNPGLRCGHTRTIPLPKPGASVKPSAWNVFDQSVLKVSCYVAENDDYGNSTPTLSSHTKDPVMHGEMSKQYGNITSPTHLFHT